MRKEMVIQQKLRDLAGYQRDIMPKKFPKKYKFTLCAEIQNSTREIQKLISRAKLRYYKKTTLEDIDIELDFLRQLAMESHEDNETTITPNDILRWTAMLDEIGAMVGGWIKTLKK